MLIVYSSPGCASCRKAKRFLADYHIPYVEKNLYSNQLDKKEIKYLLSRCENGTSDLIATRSKKYKELHGALEDMSTNELVSFIQENPSILKRPILLSPDSMVIGYDEDEITTFVPLKDRMKYNTHSASELGSACMNL
jgi:regulatory protein spx